jgi:hypothetical protein
MTQTTRTEQLRQIMAIHKLTAPAVGKILDRSPQTVRSWRCKYDQREIPATLLRLLELEVAARGAE